MYCNSEIEDRLSSFYSAKKMNFVQLKMGLNVYDIMLKHFDNVESGKMKIDYIQFHQFYESKKSIYNRLNYINQNFNVTNEFQEDVCEYYHIVEKLEIIRMKLLKYKQQDYKPCSLGKYIVQLEQLKNLEERILKKIIEELERGIV